MTNLNELVAAVDEPQNAQKQSKEERAFVARLDLFLLTFGCISQVIKYLDQTNINNAYVSGMKDDLDLHGDELNLFTTYFNVAYCIMLIPSQIIMTYVRPSWWLPSIEIVWGVITGLIAITHSAKQVYVLRAFLGLCESAAYPGMITLFMSWYTPTEMAKRIGFYHSCQSLGQMLSGALQAAIINSLSGRSGLAGWRWLFVVNAVITVVWGLAGYFMIPDMPNKPNPWAFWFKKVHSELALSRLARTNRVDAKPISWSGARLVSLISLVHTRLGMSNAGPSPCRRTFTHWLVYIVAVLYIAMVLGTSGADYFGLFLKSVRRSDGSQRWTTTDVNVIPIGVWVWAYMSDFFRTRWLLIILQATIAVMGAIIMSVWTTHPQATPLSAAYAAYFIQRTALGTAPLIWAWLSDLSPTDPEGRTLIVGASIADKFGWQSASALCALVIVLCVLLRIVDVRYLAPKRKMDAQVAADKWGDGDDLKEGERKLNAESQVSRVQSTAT
ncbi:Major facilitator superfamily transporter [Cordyceps fumosorosea ARSEF 2679]|uniref:Major facilitator superfamily transporter n=1 Tax=Cordyceps fumosorosea (strain ARSEF 2679) TaxID=1081104 RepID=A0A167V1Q2_CORFA|nr:Major facilitator superfamily transporter [Cordyceps fumosorosea ARSEF 2679]OAA62130.1 Major facilitator superfamily transporter [Cordyceps fumosorosea ARSEF 2679]